MAAIDWPLPQYKPVLDSFTIRAPNVTRRTSFEDGEDRVRRTADHRPHVFTASFECRPDEYAVLRRWIYEDINGGQAWFNLYAWIDGAYQWVEARLVAGDSELFTARPVHQGKIEVPLTYEVREMPRLDDTAYFVALIGGQTEFDTWLAGLDLAVNTDLKAAAT